MRTSKKILALLLALIMVMALGATAFASGGGNQTFTITLNDAEPGTYRAYRIFTIADTGDANNDGKYDTASYPKVHDNWVAFFTAPDGAGKDYLLDQQLPDTDPNYPLLETKLGSASKYINITEANKEAFGLLAREYAMTLTGGFNTVTVSTAGPATITVTGPGYYVVFEATKHNVVQDGFTTMVTLTNANPNATAYAKSKYVKGEKNPAAGYEASQHIVVTGTPAIQGIHYEIRGFFFPNTTGQTENKLRLRDEWTPGALNDVKVYVWWVRPGDTTWGTVDPALYTIDMQTDFFEFEIDWVKAYETYPNLVGRELYIQVAAASDPSISQHDFFSNKLFKWENGWQPWDEVPSWSNSLVLTKTDAKTGQPLAGAKFILVKKEKGNVYKFDETKPFEVYDTASQFARGIVTETYVPEDASKGALVAVYPDDKSVIPGAEDAVQGYLGVAHKLWFIDKNNLIKVDGTYERYLVLSADGKVYFPFGAGYGNATTRRTVLVTDANGKIEVNGLEDGDYVLREIEAPPGYVLNTEDIPVPLYHSTQNGTPVHAVATPIAPNVPGNFLPETGGVGTTVFYILGSCMLLGAAVLLITRRRMKRES